MKIKKSLKTIVLRLPFGRLFLQILRAITLLRFESFRVLFFEVKKNDICIDLGANVGFASLVMWLKGAKRIYALEPNLEAFNELKINLSGIKNITLLNMAISNESKKEKLYLDSRIKDKSNSKKVLELSEISTLLPEKSNVGECYFEVNAISLNNLISDFKIKPDLIKCDIEGGEYIIYEQLIENAKSLKIRKIFVECHQMMSSTFIVPHNKFLKQIEKNNLEKVIDTSWH